MPIGPGKYDDICTYVRTTAKAEGAMVIIIDGDKGCGFSVQGDLFVTLMLPQTLRNLAQQIEDSLKAGKI